jgi:nitrite reductase (NO-forming)
LEGPIVVNETAFNGVMPKLNLDAVSIASVLTYVRNSFGNAGEDVSSEEVNAVK